MARLITLFAFLFTVAFASAQADLYPATPAGQKLRSYLAAFNTGRFETLRDYLRENAQPPPNADDFASGMARRHLGIWGMTGGLDVRKVRLSESARVRVAAQSRRTGAWMEVTLLITAKAPEFREAEAPFRIVGMGFAQSEPPADLLPKTSLSEREIAQRTTALMRKLAANDGFSGVVMVAKGDKPIYTQAFGMASKAWGARNRTDTKFNLASVTKMFTAVAVSQLVERGKLAYSDSVGKIVPDYLNREVAEKVTVHHLLSHTSGLTDARNLIEREELNRKAKTIDEMIQPFVNDKLAFTPGERFSYSNAGYILLGKLIEKASGQSFFEYVKQNIFVPAGMVDTDFYELDRDIPNLATGYQDGPRGERRNNLFELGIIGSPATTAYSTARDLVRFHRALREGTLLKRETREVGWTAWTENAPDHGYGYGAHVIRYNGHRIIGHGGGWKGITNQFDMYPDLGYTVVVLSNYDVEPLIVTNLLRGWITQGRSATSTGRK
jgi:CubicO group peptidase (beta-lactamase class C family)